MNKKIKKIFILFFFLCFIFKSAEASLLWDINFGIEQYRKKNYKLAKSYLLDYIKSNPNDEDGYYWLAKTYYELKDIKNSNENFKKAHEISLKEKNIEKIDFNIDITSNIEDYFDMAAMYFEKGDLKTSNTYADLMLKVNPKSSSAYFIKAKIAQSQGDINKATQFINKAITFNNKLLKTNLAKSLNVNKLPELTLDMYQTYALEAYFSNDIMNAIRYCRKYLNISPSNVDISNMLIDLYLKNNEIPLAQNLIDNVLETTNNIQTLLYQAKIYEMRKDNKVEDILLEAYKINPNNSNVLLELGNYYLKNKDYYNSKKYFEILTNVNDSLTEGYFGYIYSLLELNQTDLAMELIRKYASLNQNSSETDFLLAKICNKKGDKEEALEYLASAIEKAKNPYYFLEEAKINYELKNWEESIDDLEMISKLPNSNVIIDEAQDYLIKSYIKIGDILKAQTLLNKKLSLDKNRIIYKYNLYNIYKLQGSENLANEKLKEIKKSKPATIQDYVDLSEIYYEQNKIDEAIKILNKGIKKFENSNILYLQKIKIFNLSNQINKAQEIINQMDKINNNSPLR